MKKNLYVGIAAFGAILSLGAFPLEWNVNYKADVPYEVEISREKLEKLASVDKNCGFEVTATTAEGKKKLDVTLFEGQRPGSVAVRFTVPAGTTALDCEPVKGGKVIAADKLNLFDGVLAKNSAWKTSNGGVVKNGNGKLLFEAKRFGDTTFRCTVDVPAEAAGKAAKFELDFKGTAKETWPCYINVDQLDANGKVLSESLTDPRWITLMRPYNTLSAHRESGRIHPKAKKLRINIKGQGINHTYASYGKIVKDKSIFLPKFEISRLAVRAAEQIPFPKYRDEFFAEGVSGKPGDYAYNTVEGTGKAFFFATHSQACWAEGKTITDPQELFYPAGDGTVEAWFYPIWSKRAKPTDYRYLISADPAPFVGIMRARGGKTKPCLAIKYFYKAQTAELNFQDYTKKVYKKKFKCDLPSKKWSHVAVQWGVGKGIQVFINGQKVFEDKKFTFNPVDVTSPKIYKARQKYHYIGNEYIASQVSVGNSRYAARSNVTAYEVPHFKGKFDLLRISSVMRYDGNFTPATSFDVDKDTRALFDFNRTFDGKTSDGLQFISGSVTADVSRIEDKLDVNGKTIDYNPAVIQDIAHPDKMLDKRNYTDVPDKEEFASARKTEQLKFKFKGNSKKSVDIDDKVFMDYIEYTNNSDKEIVHPFIRRKQEIDPRSFGDIRNTMDLEKLTQRERTNKIFQFVLSASDYYMSYQARFAPGGDVARNACYDALLMLNAYCGFECGPLNNMTANMLSCSGAVPAGQTAGYGHSFQQAWVDGKSNIYDLSAQKFFPAFNNSEPASLADVELEPGLQRRVNGNSDHFVRIGTRRYTANVPEFQERVAMSLRPGESLRMWFANDGKSNVLQYVEPKRLKDFTEPFAKDVSELVNAQKGKTPVAQVDSFFPEFGSAYLKFNNNPNKFAKNFTEVKADSFCYKVFTCYPIVYAEYAAKLADGSFAELEISTDRGKTFRKLQLDADGVTRPFYPVCARREYLIKVKAPMKKVANFSAMTQMMTNPRVMTCKLKKGTNELLYTAENNAEIDITLQYRKYAKDITITGAVVCSGAVSGFERITTVLSPAESKVFTVKGASGKAVVKTTGKIKASLENGKLTVTAPEDAEYKGIDSVFICDEGAEKQLMVITAPGAELVTAENILPVKNAVIGKTFQKTVDFGGHKSEIKIKFAAEKAPASYSIWTCRRTSIEPKWTRVHVRLPQGGDTEIYRHWNCSNEFYKSRFYGKNGRGKFTWDYPYGGDYPFQQLRQIEITQPFTELSYFYDNTSIELSEVAAVMIMPYPGQDFNNEMAKALRGVNNNKCYVTIQNAK